MPKFEKTWEKQRKLEQWWKEYSQRNVKHLRIIPRIIIFMSIATYFSGFVVYRDDYYWFIIYIILFGYLLFFAPLDKWSKDVFEKTSIKQEKEK